MIFISCNNEARPKLTFVKTQYWVLLASGGSGGVGHMSRCFQISFDAMATSL